MRAYRRFSWWLLLAGGLCLGGCVAEMADREEEPLAASQQEIVTFGTGVPISDDVWLRGQSLLTAATRPAFPEWVGDCTEASASFLVRRDGPCDAVPAPGGTWLGCDLVDSVSNGFCIYRWSTRNPPSVEDYLSLDSVAISSGPPPLGRKKITADCAPTPATCGTEPATGNVQLACTSPHESDDCCEALPGRRWGCPFGASSCAPEKIDCYAINVHSISQPSCDVCGFIDDEGRLHAIIDPEDRDAPELVVRSGTQHWILSGPAGNAVLTVQLPDAAPSPSVVVDGAY